MAGRRTLNSIMFLLILDKELSNAVQELTLNSIMFLLIQNVWCHSMWN